MAQPSNELGGMSVNDYNAVFVSDLGAVYQRNSNKFTNTGVSDYYVDSSQANIGKRPVYTMRSKECQIPSVFTSNNINLQGKLFDCKKPEWSWRCM